MFEGDLTSAAFNKAATNFRKGPPELAYACYKRHVIHLFSTALFLFARLGRR
jgi:hypothetical protein